MSHPEAMEKRPPAFISEVSVVVKDFPYSFDPEDIQGRMCNAIEHALQGKWGKDFKLSNQQQQSIGNAIESSRIEGGDIDTVRLTELISAIALENEDNKTVAE